MQHEITCGPLWIVVLCDEGTSLQYFLMSVLFITFILCFYCMPYFIVKLLIRVLHFLCVCLNAGILCIYAHIQLKFTVCCSKKFFFVFN